MDSLHVVVVPKRREEDESTNASAEIPKAVKATVWDNARNLLLGKVEYSCIEVPDSGYLIEVHPGTLFDVNGLELTEENLKKISSEVLTWYRESFTNFNFQ